MLSGSHVANPIKAFLTELNELLIPYLANETIATLAADYQAILTSMHTISHGSYALFCDLRCLDMELRVVLMQNFCMSDFLRLAALIRSHLKSEVDTEERIETFTHLILEALRAVILMPECLLAPSTYALCQEWVKQEIEKHPDSKPLNQLATILIYSRSLRRGLDDLVGEYKILTNRILDSLKSKQNELFPPSESHYKRFFMEIADAEMDFQTRLDLEVEKTAAQKKFAMEQINETMQKIFTTCYDEWKEEKPKHVLEYVQFNDIFRKSYAYLWGCMVMKGPLAVPPVSMVPFTIHHAPNVSTRTRAAQPDKLLQSTSSKAP